MNIYYKTEKGYYYKKTKKSTKRISCIEYTKNTKHIKKTKLQKGGKSTMITLSYSTPTTQFTTKVNDYPTTLYTEIQRKKFCQQLQESFRKIFKTDKSLFYFYLDCYIHNLNSTDPVICTDIPKKIYSDYLKKTLSTQDIDRFNKLSKSYISKIVNIPVSKANDEIKVKNQSNKDIIQLSITTTHNTNNTKETVTINKTLYNRLIQRDPSPEKAFLVIYRYQYLGLVTGIQGSVNPEIYTKLQKSHHAETELFASAFNATLPKYFGLFYDVEKTYGCYGNFFNAKLTRGFYVANPPFIVHLMNLMIDRVLEFVNSEKTEVSVYITVPVWDINDRKRLNKICKLKMPTDYKNDMNIEKFHKSGYTISDTLWCKENYTYYEHINKKYINYTATNVFVISNILKSFNFNYPSKIARKPISYKLNQRDPK